MGYVLVINSGSSSLKYQLLNESNFDVIRKGNIERITDHSIALSSVLDDLTANGVNLEEVKVVGHRVVHGGAIFSHPVVVDDVVATQIESLNSLAPLHNPANLMGIQALRQLLPRVPQVAVFDTAFHSTLPDYAYTYAIDKKLAHSQGIRRFGFHGTSHQYVTRRLAEILNKPLHSVNAIICHIGNGASVAAVVGGKSIDTSMGFTPLEGLVMGTRSGDIDPGVLFHLARTLNFGVHDIDELLNRRSGLLGLTGENDMRAVRERALKGDPEAILARAVYAHRIRKYIGAFLMSVPQPDAIVFTAGVGENDAELRQEVLENLLHLNIEIDAELNCANSRVDRFVQTTNSAIRIGVIATNEEAEIASQAVALIS